MIDLNEEIFSLSEELARSFADSTGQNIVSKAREFDIRKRNLLKRIKQTLQQDPIAKSIRSEFRYKSEGRGSVKSRSGSRSKSRSRSRTNSRERHVPLRSKNNVK